MNQYFSVVLIFSLFCLKNVFAEEDKPLKISENMPKDNDIVVLHLDDNMNRILFDLFVEVFGNNPNDKIEVPVSTVADIYRNYTQEQLDSLRAELKKLDYRFESIIRKRLETLHQHFLISNIDYSLNKNLTNYEKNFIQIGEQLVTLQKLVLKLTNADQPFNENSIPSDRISRKSMFTTLFDRLAGLLLGVNTEQNNYQNTEPLNQNRLNRIIAMMRALQSVKNVSANQLSPKMQTDLVKVQTLLHRLQQIQLLSRLAEQTKFLASSNMNPYGYEALLNLVKIVGTASGQNQLRALMRLFTAPQTVNQVKNTNNLSQEKLKVLMKVVEEQEKQRRQQQESQRHKELLNELLMNQRRQQQQIDSLIQLIEKQNKIQNNSNNDNNIQNGFNTYKTTTQSPITSSSNRNEVLEKLKEQRRQLNNLLKSLATDFNNNGATNNKQTNTISPPLATGGQTSDNFSKTQTDFNNILKSIGPMIGMLAQSGMITPNQSQLTKNSLSELLNQNNLKDKIQYDSYKSKASKFIDLLGSILNF